MSPSFLSLEDVLAIHRDQVERYGGATDVRDAQLLTSAVATPMVAFGGRFLHGDLHEMAAAYLYHLVQDHPFLDGNKRVGAVAADIFLALNGQRLTATPADYYELVLSVARGETSKSAVAEFLRAHTETC